MVISVDRFQSVFRPIKYHNDTSTLSPKYLISFSWIISIITGYSSVLWTNHNENGSCYFYHSIHRYQLAVFGIIGKSLPCLILIVVYGYIFVKIKVRNWVGRGLGIIIWIFLQSKSPAEKSESKKRQRLRRKELKATLRISIIVVSFLICELVSFQYEIVENVTQKATFGSKKLKVLL